MSSRPISQRALWLGMCALLVFTAGWLTHWGFQAQARDGFEFVALGDMPYNGEADELRFKRLIGMVNSRQPAFAVHIGDIKSGATPCTEAVYRKVYQQFKAFEMPLVYTPGDNEWTDCDRVEADAFEEAGRLALLRQVFYAPDARLDRGLDATVQANVHSGREAYVENVRWVKDGVLFLTVHNTGSNNNRPEWSDPSDKKKKPVDGDDAEYDARNAANLAWLCESFQMAREQKLAGVVVFTHADPFFEKKTKKRTGFNDFIEHLRIETQRFGSPVLLVHGSTHVFKIDMPLRDDTSHLLLPNFTRVLVFGDHDVQAVRIRVVPGSEELFTVHPLIVPENTEALAQ